MTVAETLQFRAHARLLTMLGEQLIKNERVALVELVKNSYDADATLVTVDFTGFGQDYEVLADSAIVILDNGSGMTEHVVRTAWMNPATPSKSIEKAKNPVTPRGRVLQGEKGIGRFATFKLGNQVSLVTRPAGENSETTLLVDISSIDEGSESESQRIDYYLEDLSVSLETGPPVLFTAKSPSSSTHGTQLEVRGLRAEWSAQLVMEAFADLDRMQPQLWAADSIRRPDFEVRFLRDGEDLNLGTERTEEFQAILERAVLRVSNGRFDDEKGQFRFELDGRLVELSLEDSEIRGLRRFRTHFQDDQSNWVAPQCGPFGFEFHVFDFGSNAPAAHWLDRDEKAMLREHRIYLYRDDIRVYPYGDPRDDWLEVDAIRGTESARSMFSNDQTVGYVTITQADNPLLRDKTSREGLLDVGRATRDFVVLIQTILSWLRSKPYEQYAAANRRVREKVLRAERFDRHIHALRTEFALPAKAVEYLDALETAIGSERELSSMQIARTEQLAGVGMSVETASHDLIAAGAESLRLAKQILGELNLLDLSREPVYSITSTLITRLDFVNSRFKDVQGLFVSTRQKSRELDIAMLTRRIRSMYSGLHRHEGIEFELAEPFELKAVSTEAAVLQCLINLVDNATYWLMTSGAASKRIRAFVPDDSTLVITDNGPGVADQDEPFIFEPFYSGKGEAGKGLGLYIARQNGLRSGFSVELGHSGDERDLAGATFMVKFNGLDEK
ncbi:ATP-binding protein [Microbacterium sp. 4R-513]|uniref:ATP-binding protein n=1 Tax=Microbacterium sp. 4R-513 TaxID=2567934 RepID=UPI0013E10A08|nr:ATP-binding protein [Microbacterium sp. 4R-513]QIG40066.1 ATP-binding protein [Microbacterium sp. 4R-513]